MTKKKKSTKTSKAPESARGVPPGSSHGGGSTPPSDLLQTAGHRDPLDGTAIFVPVTEAMLEHAAHEAAGLAEGIARHAVSLDRTAVAEPAVAPAEPPVAATGEATGADPGPDIMGDIPTPSAEALRRYNARLVDMMRTNAAATTALFAALVQARSIPEAVSINADHLGRQMATLTHQGTELATLAQSIAAEALRSFKDPTER